MFDALLSPERLDLDGAAALQFLSLQLFGEFESGLSNDHPCFESSILGLIK
jgi:hypothetical protein